MSQHTTSSIRSPRRTQCVTRSVAQPRGFEDAVVLADVPDSNKWVTSRDGAGAALGWSAP